MKKMCLFLLLGLTNLLFSTKIIFVEERIRFSKITNVPYNPIKFNGIQFVH